MTVPSAICLKSENVLHVPGVFLTCGSRCRDNRDEPNVLAGITFTVTPLDGWRSCVTSPELLMETQSMA
ncbi:hypothetical protein EXN66_Car014419 [Channa argus]|uniref:Uncharacterized protein n=1 Tax=Channa argus TaxID=215402 RepID=A0A6G1Q884_CHAAH|nr:hypothetical protein EXN66_Car014419 [Channa argus]